jgi:hypothetical protein
MGLISLEPIEECRLPDLIASIRESFAPVECIPNYQADHDYDDDEMQELICDLMIDDIPQRSVTFEGKRRILASAYAMLEL